jgi:glycerophosphoryl diester phosphodiesterase
MAFNHPAHLRARLPAAWAALVLVGGVLVAPVRVEAASPLVIGHRGAAGERPEHTATGYRLAIAEGADFIEPDLVMTKDGVLIDRHENEIGATTDVAAHPEFVGRKATKTVDGHSVTGWFSEDFTLAEIKTLRARERLPQLRAHNTAYDGKDQVLTFAEVAALAKAEGAKAGRTVGVYAELKHPTYFAKIGLAMEDKFAAEVKAAGLASRDAPFYFQCFELDALRKVRERINVKSVFLMDAEGAPADFVAAGDPRTYADLATAAGLQFLARYVDGVGPAKTLIAPRDAQDRSQPPTGFIADAHAAGMVVHPFTFRSENQFLPAELRRGADPAAVGDAQAEYLQFFRLGVDGVFSDFPDAAVDARRRFELER